jgi:hypothetical protein
VRTFIASVTAGYFNDAEFGATIATIIIIVPVRSNYGYLRIENVILNIYVPS